jgi:hypothetical protein
MKEKILIFFKNLYKKIKNHSFWGDKLIVGTFIITLFSNLVLWVLVISKSMNTEIPFYNPLALSARYLTPKGKEIFILPIIGLFVLLVNLFLSFKAFNQEKFLSYLFLGISLFIQIMLLTTIIVYLLI